MKIWLASLLAAISQLHSAIIEVEHFQEVPLHVKKETLVIFDIDDTLLIPVQMLGCDEWYLHRLKQGQRAGLSAHAAFEKALNEWEAIRFLTKMEIVEPESDKIVHSLQDQNYCVMGLTTQGLALATKTVQQLKENRFDLSLTAPSKEDHYFSIGGHGVLYRRGILFTSGTSKGESLFALLDKLEIKPERIVFLNDKASHIKDIEQVAEKRGVEFLGLRYAYSDSRKKAFSPEIADFEWDHSLVSHLLSDEEAKKEMQDAPAVEALSAMNSADILANRFIMTSDQKMGVVAGMPLRSTWWSRPYEYAWAAQFAGPQYVVLDAACGISHPFKWFLSETCKETWACDVDSRIAYPEQIIQETYDDLGKTAYDVLTKNPHLLERVKRLHCSICKLPDEMPKFDRIFCISTLEHMSVIEQRKAFAEFSRVLAPDGLLVITFDYPVVSPEHLYTIAATAGLIPARDLREIQPKQDALNNAQFYIYRCVFKRA